MFAKLKINPKSMMEFGSTQIIKESVEAGLGVSLLSQWVIRKELTLHKLHTLEIKGFPIARKLSIYRISNIGIRIIYLALRSQEGYNLIP